MRTLQLGRMDGVVSGQKATINLPTGDTYKSLMLQRSGLQLDDIERIRVVANSRTIQEFDNGVALERINLYQGLSPALVAVNGRPAETGNALDAVAGVSTISFDLPQRKTRDAEELTSLVTGNFRPQDYQGDLITNLSLEIQIKAGAAAGGSIEVFANVADFAPAQHRGFINQWFVRPAYVAAAAGIYQINDLPQTEPIVMIILDSLKSAPAGIGQGDPNIKSVELSVTSQIIRSRSFSVNQKIGNNYQIRNTDVYGSTPSKKIRSDNFYPVDFAELGYTRDILRVGQGATIAVKMDLEQADTFPVYYQTIGIMNSGVA